MTATDERLEERLREALRYQASVTVAGSRSWADVQMPRGRSRIKASWQLVAAVATLAVALVAGAAYLSRSSPTVRVATSSPATKDTAAPWPVIETLAQGQDWTFVLVAHSGGPWVCMVKARSADETCTTQNATPDPYPVGPLAVGKGVRPWGRLAKDVVRIDVTFTDGSHASPSILRPRTLTASNYYVIDDVVKTPRVVTAFGPDGSTLENFTVPNIHDG